MSLVGRYVSYHDRKDREILVEVIAVAFAGGATLRDLAGNWSLLVLTDTGELKAIQATDAQLLNSTEARRLIKNQRRRKEAG